MLPAERENFIFEELNKNGVVKVEELAERLNVTPMTIRRDLDKLEKLGIAFRSHGGAVLRNPLQKEQTYDSKKLANLEAKRKIAGSAFDMVKEGDTILLDAGTTTFELAILLKQRKDLTVITNDIKIGLELYQSKNRLFIAGGQIQNETASVIGPTADMFISNIRVDIAFIGTSSISKDWILFTPTFEKATLKRRMIECAKRAVLLGDKSKFGRDSFSKICSLQEIDIWITDKKFTDEEAVMLTEMNVQVISVE